MLKSLLIIASLTLSIPSQAYTIATYGDSLAVGYGNALKQQYKRCKVLNYGINSTGLLKQRSIDWFNRIDYLNSNYKTDLAFLSFGANDAGMNINKIKWNTDAWSIEYSNRLEKVITNLQSEHTTIVFMQIPVFTKNKLRQAQNEILMTIQDKVLDRYNIYKPVLVDVQADKYKAVDGIHYNANGYKQAIDVAVNSNIEIKRNLVKCQ